MFVFCWRDHGLKETSKVGLKLRKSVSTISESNFWLLAAPAGKKCGKVRKRLRFASGEKALRCRLCRLLISGEAMLCMSFSGVSNSYASLVIMILKSGNQMFTSAKSIQICGVLNLFLYDLRLQAFPSDPDGHMPIELRAVKSVFDSTSSLVSIFLLPGFGWISACF